MNLADRLRWLGLRKPKPWQSRPELLLNANVPQPLYGVNPRTVLGQKWWDEERRRAYRSTGQRCAVCGVGGRLEAHEVYEIDYLLGRMTYLEAVPLCRSCHMFIHSGRLLALVEQSKLPEWKYKEVLSRGERILREAGLTYQPPCSGPIADWADWRLIVDDKEYPPKYATPEDWQKEFG